MDVNENSKKTKHEKPPMIPSSIEENLRSLLDWLV
jgi:hypothetical protein